MSIPSEVQPVIDTGSISVQTTNQAEPFYRFSNRHRPGSFLRLSSYAYTNLLQGKDVSLFNPKSLSFMTVRVRSRSSLSANESVFVGECMDDVHQLVSGGSSEAHILEEVVSSDSVTNVSQFTRNTECLPVEVSFFRFVSKRFSRRHFKSYLCGLHEDY